MDGVRVRRWGVSAGYARFYAPLAIAVVVLTDVPLYPDTVDPTDGTTTSFGNFWHISATFDGGLVLLSVVLLAALVVLLVVGSFAPATAIVPALTALAGGGLLAMVLARPFDGVPRPDLGSGGHVAVTVGVVIIMVAVVHTIHLTMVVRPASTVDTPAPVRAAQGAELPDGTGADR